MISGASMNLSAKSIIIHVRQEGSLPSECHGHSYLSHSYSKKKKKSLSKEEICFIGTCLCRVSQSRVVGLWAVSN